MQTLRRFWVMPWNASLSAAMAPPAGLAADLHRYLSGDPVIARPPSAAYRLRKRIRKHRKSLFVWFGPDGADLSIAGYVGLRLLFAMGRLDRGRQL